MRYEKIAPPRSRRAVEQQTVYVIISLSSLCFSFSAVIMRKRKRVDNFECNSVSVSLFRF